MCRLRDWRTLGLLIRDAFPEIPLDETRYCVRADGAFSCIAWVSGQPVGYWMHSAHRAPMSGWVEQIGVARNFRNRGFGRLILADYLKFAAWAGFRNVGGSVFKANTASLATFQSLGFKTAPDSSEDRLQVWRDITSADSREWSAAETLPRSFLDSANVQQQFCQVPNHSLLRRTAGWLAMLLVVIP